MAKTKIEKIRGIEEQIQQLENERKRLLQQHKEQERKARTNRLCKRGGLLEKMLPDTITLTDEQFQTFMEKTMLTPFTRRIREWTTSGRYDIIFSGDENGKNNKDMSEMRQRKRKNEKRV